MAYFTQSDVLALMSEEALAHWLDDGRGLAEADNVFAAVCSAAQDRIDALLEPLYSVPFADGAVPASVKTAALNVFAAMLYRRRGTPDSDNPFAASEKTALDRMDKAGRGDIRLTVDVLPVELTGEIDDDDLDFAITNQAGL